MREQEPSIEQINAKFRQHTVSFREDIGQAQSNDLRVLTEDLTIKRGIIIFSDRTPRATFKTLQNQLNEHNSQRYRAIIEWHELKNAQNTDQQKLDELVLLQMGRYIVGASLEKVFFKFYLNEENVDTVCLKKTLELQHFNSYGMFKQKILDVSMSEFTEDKKKVGDLSKQLVFFTSLFYAFKVDNNELLEINFESELENQYQEIAARHSEDSILFLRTAAGITDENLGRFKTKINCLKGHERQSGNEAITVIENIKRFQKTVREVLLDPTHSDFPILSSIVYGIFASGADFKLSHSFFLSIGLNCEEDTRVFYRKAKRLESGLSKKDALLYRLLTGRMIQLTRTNQGNFIPYSLVNENTEIFNAREYSNKHYQDIVDLEKIKSEINKIVALKKQFDWPLSSLQIDWGAVVPLEDAVLSFDRSNPQRINLGFTYRSEDGEELSFKIKLDVKKGQFDWTFIDDPNDPAMMRFKQEYYNLISSAVTVIRIQLENDKKNKKVVTTSITTLVPSQASESRIRSEKPAVDNLNIYHQKRNHAQMPPNSILDQPARMRAILANNIKYIIEFSHDHKEKVKKLFSSEVAYRIERALEQLERTGIGDLTMMLNKYRDIDNKPLWRLRVGQVRVLMREVGGGASKRIFVVENILPRSGAYQHLKSK